MPALNFKKQFATAVLSGEKSMTIRQPRKRPFAVGDTVYLYTGLRTKNCRNLGTRTVIFVADVKIGRFADNFGITWALSPDNAFQRFIADKLPSESVAEYVARRDGFGDYIEMQDWFASMYGLPFEGQLIMWAPHSSKTSTQKI